MIPAYSLPLYSAPVTRSGSYTDVQQQQQQQQHGQGHEGATIHLAIWVVLGVEAGALVVLYIILLIRVWRGSQSKVR
jgi:hypothetical protein